MNWLASLFTRRKTVIIAGSRKSRYSKWEWVFIAIGIVATFYSALSLFTLAGENNPTPYIELPVPEVRTAEFQQLLAGTVNSTVESGSPITTLTDGDEFLHDLLIEIADAKETIYMSNYIWDDGEFGTIIFNALIEKAKEGVKVRVLLDGLGSRKASKESIEELERVGGKVTYFRPLQLLTIPRINKRNHVRDITIDGKVGYLGGLAISDPWLGNASTPDSWHDFMFKVTGNAATHLEKIFTNLWSETEGEILPSTKKDFLSTTTSTGTHFIMLLTVPSPDYSTELEHFTWLSIMAATKSIHIETPYLLPNYAIMEALEQKARSGVEVVIIGPNKTDSKLTKLTSQIWYTEMLESGIKIYEYDPALIHSKVITIDNSWTIIGSANMDNRSHKLNLELMMGVDDKDFAYDIERKIREDKMKSKEITLENWDHNNYLDIPLEILASFLIVQY